MKKLVVAMSLLLTSSAFAQDAAPAAANGATDGAKSLSFSIPNGGNGYANGALGLWSVMGDMNVGVNVGLAYNNIKDAANWDLLLAPTIRKYTSQTGNVLPFYLAQLNLRMHDDGNDQTDDDPEVSVAGGMGCEYFFNKNLSIAGHVGVGIDVLRAGKDINKPVKLGTLTSGLTLQIYQN